MHLVMAATDGVKSCPSASQDLLAYYQGLPRFVFYTDTPLLLVLEVVFVQHTQLRCQW